MYRPRRYRIRRVGVPLRNRVIVTNGVTVRKRVPGRNRNRVVRQRVPANNPAAGVSGRLFSKSGFDTLDDLDDLDLFELTSVGSPEEVLSSLLGTGGGGSMPIIGSGVIFRGGTTIGIGQIMSSENVMSRLKAFIFLGGTGLFGLTNGFCSGNFISSAVRIGSGESARTGVGVTFVRSFSRWIGFTLIGTGVVLCLGGMFTGIGVGVTFLCPSWIGFTLIGVGSFLRSGDTTGCGGLSTRGGLSTLIGIGSSLRSGDTVRCPGSFLVGNGALTGTVPGNTGADGLVVVVVTVGSFCAGAVSSVWGHQR